MSRSRGLRSALLAIALAGAAGTIGALWGTGSRAESEREPLLTATGGAPPPRPAPGPEEGVRLPPQPPVPPVLAQARVPEAPVPAESLPALREELLRELAALLRDANLHHVRWDRELAAAGRGFTREDAGALAAGLADARRPREERIACAELLGQLVAAEFSRGGPGDSLSALGDAGLDFLRREAPPGRGDLLGHAAAARALAVLGDDGDRASIVARLADPSDEVALSAAWSLSAAPREDLALELARLASSGGVGESRRLRGAALVALEGMLRRGGATERLSIARDSIAERLAPLFFDAQGPEELGIRAAGLLATTGGERAKQVLERALLQDPSRPNLARALARGYLACAATDGVGASREWEAHQGRMRFELACATAEHPSSKEMDVQVRGRLAAELEGAVNSEPSGAARRRALRALAALGTAEGRALLEKLASSDPDAATRVAATEALEGIE